MVWRGDDHIDVHPAFGYFLNVILEADEIGARIEQILEDHLGDAEAAGGVFAARAAGPCGRRCRRNTI